MRGRTVVISFLVHAVLAGVLLSRAETRARRRPVSVAVTGEQKKKPQVKPAPPKPIVHPAPRPKAQVAKVEAAAPAPAHEVKAAAAPAATSVALSNADLAPGGIALPGTPKAEARANPVKVAQAVPEAVRKRITQAATPEAAAEEAACDEEPTKPVAVFKPEIEYTPAARADGVEGRLVLTLTVGADGSVTDVHVESGVDPALDAASVETAKQWRFKPAMKCGKPVAGGTYKFATRFELAN